MEYVAGETLADLLLVRGRFTPTETLAIGREMALALAAAHAAGIVHRDLKPENIKLVEGQVKVLDFGIAQAAGLDRITTANRFLGTPTDCAPERAEGEGDIRAELRTAAEPRRDQRPIFGKAGEKLGHCFHPAIGDQAEQAGEHRIRGEAGE